MKKDVDVNKSLNEYAEWNIKQIYKDQKSKM